MRTTLHIARSELRHLFYSPLAWVVLIALYLVSAFSYFETERGFLIKYVQGGYGRISLEFLTSKMVNALFTPHPLRQTVVNYLYLFLPLVTMGVLAREFRNGTDKLLFSAPVSTRQLVFGKYLGLMAFNLFIVAAAGIVLGIIGISVDRADWGLIGTTLLGFYLLVMLLAAIGLYISSLTSYPIVAGLITLVSFGLLFNYLTTFMNFLVRHAGLAGTAAMVKIPYVMDYIRIHDFEYGKMHYFFKGILHSRDILYFLNLTVVFLGLTLIRIKAKRQRVARRSKLAQLLTLFACAALVGYLSSRPELTAVRDTTREQVHTITRYTQELLKSMEDGPLEVTYYANLLDANGWHYFFPARVYELDKYWGTYRRFKTDIRFRIIYYYDYRGGEPNLHRLYPGETEREIADRYNIYYGGLAMRLVLTPGDMAAKEDLAFEQYRNVAKLSYRGRSTFLRNFPQPPNPPSAPYLPEEREVAPALHRLVGSQPRLFFSVGHAELDPEGLGDRGVRTLLNDPILKYAMINQGLDSDTINVASGALPDSARLLAICDPRLPLSQGYIDRFEEYLAQGKNLLIMLGPDSRAVVAPLLDRLGLRALPGVLGSVSDRYSGEFVSAYLAHTAKAFSKELGRFLEKEAYYRQDSVWLSMNGAVALEQVREAGFQVEPFLILDTVNSFNRPSASMKADMEGKLTRLPTDEVAPFSLGYTLTRTVNGREQRIAVIGDADVRSDLLSTAYAPHLFGWLSDSGFPLDLVRPEPHDKTFTLSKVGIHTRKWLWIFGVTGAMVLLASVVLIRRNRK